MKRGKKFLKIGEIWETENKENIQKFMKQAEICKSLTTSIKCKCTCKCSFTYNSVVIECNRISIM